MTFPENSIVLEDLDPPPRLPIVRRSLRLRASDLQRGSSNRAFLWERQVRGQFAQP